jgi:TonB family protein
LLLGVAAPAWAALVAPPRYPVITLPRVLERVAPDYPDSLRRDGVQGAIPLDVHLTETGAVAGFDTGAGPDPLRGLALAAVRRWRFSPQRRDGVPESSWVSVVIPFPPLDTTATSVVAKPIPVLREPLVQPGDGVDAAGPPFLGTIGVRIGADGLVHAAHFVGAGPADSTRILARARAWRWIPARDARGRDVEAATTVRVPAQWRDAAFLARPDSALGNLLGAADQASISITDRDGSERTREVDPIVLAHVFAEWISDPHAYDGQDPWQARCSPHFDAHLAFSAPTGDIRVGIARDCCWMQVGGANRQLVVPYRAIKERVEADLRRLMFGDAPGAGR